MADKTFDKQLEKIRSSIEKDKKPKQSTKKETKDMKKLTINPQIIGAIKLILIIAVLAAAFYAGTQYQEQYHSNITNEARSLVSKLKQ